jgi:hypothetical protein
VNLNNRKGIEMTNFIIGGWSQNARDVAPAGFAYTMYGMITNLHGLTAGTPNSPGWSPKTTAAPTAETGSVMWTYGGGGATPENMPNNEAENYEIVRCTNQQHWAGVDFDDESNMDINNVVAVMKQLKQQQPPLQSSYTFLAGWDYNNPNASSSGQSINDAVQKVAQANCSDRFILMCYADKMWSNADIQANVGSAIERTINNGVPKKEVILALTSVGLNAENLDYFLEQVTTYDIGGLFIWDFATLPPSYLSTIKNKLDIN